MKVYIYYVAKNQSTETMVDEFDFDILPHLGAKIKVHDAEGHFTDCLVEDLMWDVTDEKNPCVKLIAREA